MKGLLILAAVFLLGCSKESGDTPADKPNILLIITDDQGYGDIGMHGNHFIRTLVLDSLAALSTRIDPFYVSPVCAPTRSSLMTGRYHLRTGVYDTYNGGAMMATGELTIAELLAENGYKTAMISAISSEKTVLISIPFCGRMGRGSEGRGIARIYLQTRPSTI